MSLIFINSFCHANYGTHVAKTDVEANSQIHPACRGVSPDYFHTTLRNHDNKPSLFLKFHSTQEILLSHLDAIGDNNIGIPIVT